MAELLTKGAVKEIALNPNDLPKNPVLQVLGLKRVTSGQGGNTSERYRMVLSDSVHAHTCAMLATQLNSMAKENQLDSNAIIRLDKYICNTIHEARKVLIVLGLTVLQKGEGTPRFGEPTPYDQKNEKSGPPKPNNKPSVQQSSVSSSNKTVSTSNGSRFNNKQAQMSRTDNGPSVFPISSLNPYQGRWTICARVTSKSSIREWSNSRGQGRLFNVDLIDESGEIRATCFTDQVDKFFPLLEQNKVYYISRGSLRPANKKYSSIKNDYEMTFNRDTTIEQCNEESNLPTLQFNFREIGNIPEIEADQLTDVIGVCSSASDVVEITTRAGKQVLKRDIQLMDQTASVNCTIWGKEAQDFEQYVGAQPIVAIKGARVSDFGGRSLSVLSSSVLQIDPDNLEEAFKLRGWYDSVGSSQNISSISNQRGEGIVSNVVKNIEDIQLEHLGSSEKPDYFNVIATTTFYHKDNCLYKACPKPDCNKKVIEDGNHYRCEKCNQTYPDFKHRLILRVNSADHTGEQWLTLFQDTAELLLEKSADEIGELREADEKAYEHAFNRRLFVTRKFHVRAKVDTYNDETRVKCTVDKVLPVDFRKETRRLADEIDKLME